MCTVQLDDSFGMHKMKCPSTKSGAANRIEVPAPRHVTALPKKGKLLLA